MTSRIEEIRSIITEKQPKVNDEVKAECNHHYLTAYDTVYVFTESDIDICFEKIENIRFCPLCGMELKGKR